MRNARFVLAPLFVLVTILAACSKPTDADVDLLGELRVFLSPDTVNLFVVDVGAFADTEAFRKIEAELRATEGIGEVIDELGVPLSDVAKRAAFAMADPEEGGGHSTSVHVAIETTLDDGFLQRVMSEAGDGFEAEVVDGVTMWVHTDADVTVALVQFPGGYLGFGHADAVRAMVQRAVAGSGGLAQDARPLLLARDLAAGAIAWGVVRAHPLMTAQLPDVAGDLSGLEHGVVALTQDAAGDTIVEARAITKSAQDAQDMEGRIQLIAGMGALSDDLDPDIADVLASLSVGRQGDTVSLRAVLTSEFITSLFGGAAPFHRD
jgi:hypothetical protein